jgi:toxin-antitoxin system PIN domain toxin
LILIDANVLLYAYHPQASQHVACRRWLEQTFNGTEQVGLAWLTLLAFIRIATNPRVFERPLTIDEVLDVVGTWIAQPQAIVLAPGERYWTLLQTCLRTGQATGPLAMDAALAALALENGAVLCSTDRDFARFTGLKLFNPLS